MAVATDVATHASLGAGTTTTFSFACGAGKSALYVSVGHWDGGNTSSSVTFNGSAMTKVAEEPAVAPWDRVELFRTTSPANVTANVVVTHSSGSSGGAAAFTTTGQDTTTPDSGANQTRNTAGTTSIVLSGFTVPAGDLLVGAVGWDSSAAGNPAGSAHTPAASINFSTNANSEGDGALSTTGTSIQVDFSGTTSCAFCAIVLKASAGGGPPAVPFPPQRTVRGVG